MKRKQAPRSFTNRAQPTDSLPDSPRLFSVRFRPPRHSPGGAAQRGEARTAQRVCEAAAPAPALVFTSVSRRSSPGPARPSPARPRRDGAAERGRGRKGRAVRRFAVLFDSFWFVFSRGALTFAPLCFTHTQLRAHLRSARAAGRGRSPVPGLREELRCRAGMAASCGGSLKRSRTA